MTQHQAASPSATIDTSNYRKHTSDNPLQRWLIGRFHRRLMAKLAELQPGSFLDAGCGEGFVARLALDRLPGLRLTGFDHNPAAVCHAARLCPEASLLTASIFHLPFADRSFDYVGCFEVLEHLADPGVALAELARVARQGVILSVPEEPFFSLANVARGKNLTVTPHGSDPDHRQIWTRPAFAAFVASHLEVILVGGSFPWTICVGMRR